MLEGVVKLVASSFNVAVFAGPIWGHPDLVKKDQICGRF